MGNDLVQAVNKLAGALGHNCSLSDTSDITDLQELHAAFRSRGAVRIHTVRECGGNPPFWYLEDCVSVQVLSYNARGGSGLSVNAHLYNPYSRNGNHGDLEIEFKDVVYVEKTQMYEGGILKCEFAPLSKTGSWTGRVVGFGPMWPTREQLRLFNHILKKIPELKNVVDGWVDSANVNDRQTFRLLHGLRPIFGVEAPEKSVLLPI